MKLFTNISFNKFIDSITIMCEPTEGTNKDLYNKKARDIIVRSRVNKSNIEDHTLRRVKAAEDLRKLAIKNASSISITNNSSISNNSRYFTLEPNNPNSVNSNSVNNPNQLNFVSIPPSDHQVTIPSDHKVTIPSDHQLTIPRIDRLSNYDDRVIIPRIDRFSNISEMSETTRERVKFQELLTSRREQVISNLRMNPIVTTDNPPIVTSDEINLSNTGKFSKIKLCFNYLDLKKDQLKEITIHYEEIGKRKVL
jgi:hypothetical protein